MILSRTLFSSLFERERGEKKRVILSALPFRLSCIWEDLKRLAVCGTQICSFCRTHGVDRHLSQEGRRRGGTWSCSVTGRLPWCHGASTHRSWCVWPRGPRVQCMGDLIGVWPLDLRDWGLGYTCTRSHPYCYSMTILGVPSRTRQ
jgi:hypothetical protein